MINPPLPPCADRDPIPANDDEHDIREADGAVHGLHEVRSALDGIGVEEDPPGAESGNLTKMIVKTADMAGAIGPPIADEQTDRIIRRADGDRRRGAAPRAA